MTKVGVLLEYVGHFKLRLVSQKSSSILNAKSGNSLKAIIITTMVYYNG